MEQIWISLGTFLILTGTTIVGIVLGIRKVSDETKKTIESRLDGLNSMLHELELMHERRMGEMGRSLREKINEVEFHLRDHYVSNPVFERVIDMASANMENSFRVLQSSIDRINDKLDRMHGPH